MKRKLLSLSLTIIASRVSKAFLSLSNRGVTPSTYLSVRLSRKLTTLVPCLLLPCQTQSTAHSIIGKTSCQIMNSSSSSSSNISMEESENGTLVDKEYPGTAVKRLRSVHKRVASLSEVDLNGDWEDVRRKLLWAGGLKDLPNSIPGQVSYELRMMKADFCVNFKTDPILLHNVILIVCLSRDIQDIHLMITIMLI